MKKALDVGYRVDRHSRDTRTRRRSAAPSTAPESIVLKLRDDEAFGTRTQGAMTRKQRLQRASRSLAPPTSTSTTAWLCAKSLFVDLQAMEKLREGGSRTIDRRRTSARRSRCRARDHVCVTRSSLTHPCSRRVARCAPAGHRDRSQAAPARASSSTTQPTETADPIRSPRLR